MFVHYSRKILVAALLATAVSAPALASDEVMMQQQTALGQVATEMTAQQAPAAIKQDPAVIKQSFATVNKAPMAEPRARRKAADARPSAPTRQARAPAQVYAAAERAPLILGVRY
jgi:hypothetical protein